MDQPLPSPVQIGQHAGWTLFFDPNKKDFIAQKGRKIRRSDYISHLTNEVDDENAKAERAEMRTQPCRFRLWRDDKQEEMLVDVSSYSNQGFQVKPAAGGDAFAIESRYRDGRHDYSVPVIRDGVDSKRLHVAVEMLRRAEQELKDARKAIVTDVPRPDRNRSQRTADYFVDEDKIRQSINNLNVHGKLEH